MNIRWVKGPRGWSAVGQDGVQTNLWLLLPSHCILTSAQNHFVWAAEHRGIIMDVKQCTSTHKVQLPFRLWMHFDKRGNSAIMLKINTNNVSENSKL